jgi:hypothetical protein
MKGQMMPKTPNVSIVSSQTSAQCNDGGAGSAARVAEVSAPPSRLAENDSGMPGSRCVANGGGATVLASGGGSGRLLAGGGNRLASDTQSVRPSRQARASVASLPSLSHCRTSATLYGPYFLSFWPIQICSSSPMPVP